jgi:hypothetical protein
VAIHCVRDALLKKPNGVDNAQLKAQAFGQAADFCRSGREPFGQNESA